jgi:ABC-type multidrug transport system ATPase subunit
MKINLINVGKRYNREWIFRNFNYTFSSQKSYAIIGPNGSGKSTLLQIIAGAIIFNEGEIEYNYAGKNITAEKVYSHISIAAPYLELIEEMTLVEFFNFHSKLKKWIPQFDTNKIISLLELQIAANKQIRYFSSGMKQRVKLAQAIFSDVPVVLLDEPCTNLDAEGIDAYKKFVAEHCLNRLLIVSSNDKQEYDFCEEVIDMKELKSSFSKPFQSYK